MNSYLLLSIPAASYCLPTAFHTTDQYHQFTRLPTAFHTTHYNVLLADREHYGAGVAVARPRRAAPARPARLWRGRGELTLTDLTLA